MVLEAGPQPQGRRKSTFAQVCHWLTPGPCQWFCKPTGTISRVLVAQLGILVHAIFLLLNYLQGLGGPTEFTVSLISGLDKVRHILELYVHYVFCHLLSTLLFGI